MDRIKYIAEMKNLLSFMDRDDRTRVLRYYEERFDEAGDDGEAALIRSLGSPIRQVLQVEKQYREREEAGIYGVAPVQKEENTAEPFVPEVFGIPSFGKITLDEPESTYTELTYSEPEEEPKEATYQPEPEEEEPEADEDDGMGQMLRDAFGVEDDAEEAADEEEYEEDFVPPYEPRYEEEPVREAKSEDQPASGGRIAAAVLLTPVIVLAAILGLVLALVLSAVALIPAALFGAAAVYLGLYAFQNLHYLPDMLAVMGVAIICVAAALLFAWLGIWIAAEGIVLVVRMIGGIYRRVLHGGAKNG